MKFSIAVVSALCSGLVSRVLEKEKSRLEKVLAPDDDDYDFAEDDDDNPADFSVGQFVDEDNDDAFVQLKRHLKTLRERKAPDDDEFDFAEDDDDNPADFSVGQFLGDDDDNEAFIQFKSRGIDDSDDGNDYADDRLESDYVTVEEREQLPKHRQTDSEADADNENKWEQDEEDADTFIQKSDEEHPKKHHLRNHHHAKRLTLTKKNEPAKKVKKESKKGPKDKKAALLGVTDVNEQLVQEEKLEKEGKLNDEKEWEGMDDDDADDGEESFIQTSASDSGDEDDEYGDDRLDGDIGSAAEVEAENEDEEEN